MIKIEDLNYKYKTGDFALKDINLQIENNEFINEFLSGFSKNLFIKSTYTISKHLTEL